MDPEIDAFLEEAPDWPEEMAALRSIALDCGLEETLKWGKPCYTFQGSNVVIIQPFKDACALMFFKGALLDDPEELLEPPGPNSRAARRIKVTSVEEIGEVEDRLRAFIAAAVEAEKAGLEVPDETEPEPIPEELQEAFEEVPGLQEAFEDLTPGRQRGYILHVSRGKRSQTRTARVQRCIPQILDGQGLHD